jgi:F-type H+-transporting ATPase subunit gamma
LHNAGDLQAVVRSMKAMAASNIGQYEQALRALADYARSVDSGLGVCFRQRAPGAPFGNGHLGEERPMAAVVFGSDQGLVGGFNEEIVDFAREALERSHGMPRVWAVGERAQARLIDTGIALEGGFPVPGSIRGIAPLIGQLLLESETLLGENAIGELRLFFNRPTSGSLYEPYSQRLLPLDERWRRELETRGWPTQNLPEIVGGDTVTLRAYLREYLFVSLFRACAESLASENASRLAAMQRAEKNIGERLEQLNGTFNRLRQSDIDEELFDVLSGFEALGRRKPAVSRPPSAQGSGDRR